ncbi:CUE domain-containing protein [Cinnamomum micranthum f. kanehirae]|uniref:CUE domain-containing protein n=1 Tax=Cinnamomum micranthum f. kanehirae TaxID=337451 RepID=A0A443NAX5_9MAGN|nr:CUE domain-containing protein [Cinnamomum micranthum f. kanehirae]
MSAIVCGKRSFFEDVHSPPPSSVSKRLRCTAGSSPVRLSPPRTAVSSSSSDSSSAIAHLIALFPDMDQQLLERALEACGNDLDSAIKSLNELRLGSADNKSDSMGTNDQLPSQGGDPASEDVATQNNLPTNGSEWVDLFVSEMMNASDMDDAKARASRILEVLEKSIASRAGVEAAEGFQKENMMLKEQVDLLIRENNILKRAVTIQHERQKEYDERSQELQQLKQLVSQYQEQLRTLEVNNYALTMHLRQAQQSNSIPGRFHPDVF